MKIITIGSPDKLAINMFVSFLSSSVGATYIVSPMHSLMSVESRDIYIKDITEKNKKVIFSYYAKKTANNDPEKVIPKNLIEMSDAVVWFNLYSTAMSIVKDECGFSNLYYERWKKNIERMDAI